MGGADGTTGGGIHGGAGSSELSEWWQLRLPAGFDPVERARLVHIARGTASGLSPALQVALFARALAPPAAAARRDGRFGKRKAGTDP